MTHIQSANPENDVFGNVGGVIGDAFQMPRGQNELHARADERASWVMLLHQRDRRCGRDIDRRHRRFPEPARPNSTLRKISAPKLRLTMERTASVIGRQFFRQLSRPAFRAER